MSNIALTSRYPFAGCSRLAKELRDNYGFYYISMSQVLIQQYCLHIQELSGGTINPAPDDIVNDKEKYRSNLGTFCQQYEDDFIDILLTECALGFGRSIVIEKVRTDKQADTFINNGFKLFRIERPEHDVLSVARKHGHSDETWNALIHSGSEGRVTSTKITDTLTNSFSCDLLCEYLVRT